MLHRSWNTKDKLVQEEENAPIVLITMRLNLNLFDVRQKDWKCSNNQLLKHPLSFLLFALVFRMNAVYWKMRTPSK